MSLEESLVEYYAPTLAGIKVANLYCFFPEDSRQFDVQMKLWREWFSRHGLRLMVLRGSHAKNSYLLYLYRPSALVRELERSEVQGFLHSLGYDVTAGQDGLLRQLGQRLRSGQDFPHEIGVFLGYPLEDVMGFIENQGKNYTLFASMMSIIIIPRLLLTPLSGVLADRTRKIRLMSWVVLGEAAVLGMYALLSASFSMGIGWIYLLVVVLEIGEVFYDGSAAAILPELVPQNAIKDARSPCGSASTSKTFLPCIASPIPKLTAVVVFPTPPF